MIINKKVLVAGKSYYVGIKVDTSVAPSITVYVEDNSDFRIFDLTVQGFLSNSTIMKNRIADKKYWSFGVDKAVIKAIAKHVEGEL
ncbi:MAG: hypothetical protein ACRCSY_06050 [Cetobacterium sp.]